MDQDKSRLDEKIKLGSSKTTQKLPGSILHCCSPFTSPSNSSTLIPRHVITLIQAFPFMIDIAMENSSRGHHRGHPPRSGSQSVGQGIPVVHAAIMDRNQELLQTILTRQPDLINAHDEAGRTPLSCAARCGYADLVEYLLKEFPISISKRDKDSSYAVHKTCLGGHIDILKVFHLYSPKSLLVQDRNGRTILHVAAKEHRDKLKHVVTYLVALPDIGKQLVSITDEDGKTPFAVASKNDNRQIQKILEQYMA